MDFDASFEQILRGCENLGEVQKNKAKDAGAEPPKTVPARSQPVVSPSPRGSTLDDNTSETTTRNEEERDGDNNQEQDKSAFNAAVLSKKLRKKQQTRKVQEDAGKKKAVSTKGGKKARQWNDWGMSNGNDKESKLDFTDGPADQANVAQIENFNKLSLVDDDVDDSDLEEGEIIEDQKELEKKGGSLLSSFVRNLGVSVMGTQALTRSDIESSLQDLKKKLMERNVAEEIANKYVKYQRVLYKMILINTCVSFAM